MLPYAPPPYPPPPALPSPAAKHVQANAILMIVLAVLHLCGVGSVVMNVAAFVERYPDLGHLSPNALGELTAYVGAAIWSVGGVVWAPINAHGLFQRRAWARTSSMIYWVLQCLSCCCFPFGAYGLWALTRPEVKQLFTARG